jgi:hypothetical protein
MIVRYNERVIIRLEFGKKYKLFFIRTELSHELTQPNSNSSHLITEPD